MNPVTQSTLFKTICEPDSFLGYTSTCVYIDTIINAKGCDSIRTLYLTVPLLSPDLGPDITFCPEDSILLFPGHFDYYQWWDGDTLSTVKPVLQNGVYSVTVSNDMQCLRPIP